MHEFLLDNLIGDLEYHPKRGILYLGLGLGSAALGFWTFGSFDDNLTMLPLLFGAGSLTLLLKGIFFLRKSSEGLALTQHELTALSSPSRPKPLPKIPTLAAQVVQDFGTGPLFAGPILHFVKRVNESFQLSFPVFLVGAVIFSSGWLARRFTSRKSSLKSSANKCG